MQGCATAVTYVLLFMIMVTVLRPLVLSVISIVLCLVCSQTPGRMKKDSILPRGTFRNSHEAS